MVLDNVSGQTPPFFPLALPEETGAVHSPPPTSTRRGPRPFIQPPPPYLSTAKWQAQRCGDRRGRGNDPLLAFFTRSLP